MNKDAKKILGILIGAGAAVVTAGLSAYLAKGRREENSLLIPEAIEGRIDKVVAWLDRQVGKKWVDKGLDIVQSLLFSNLPRPLAVLADVVYEAESKGRKQGWSGQQKREFAKTHVN